MRQRFMAIVNPTSGRRSVVPLVRAIGENLAKRGGRLIIHETQGPGHASHLASSLEAGTEALLIAGGDGTASEVLHGLNGNNVPVFALASGTENLLAREFSMPTDVSRVSERLLSGEAVPYDIGVVNGRRFMVVAGIGFDAECVLRMTRTRRGHITHWSYFWPIWRTFWEHKFPVLRVCIDRKETFEFRGFALIGNLPRYSVGMRLLSAARPDDGLLDLVMFRCISHAKMAGHLLRALTHRHLKAEGVEYRQGKSFEINSASKVPIELDGEFAGFLPASCGILERAVWLLSKD